MIKKLLLDIKIHINFRYVIMTFIIVNIVTLFDWNFTTLLVANGMVVLMVLCAYLQAKLESKCRKVEDQDLIVPPAYRIKELTYNDEVVYFIPEYYNSNDEDWKPIHRIYVYGTYEEALTALNEYKRGVNIPKRYVTEEKIHNVE